MKLTETKELKYQVEFTGKKRKQIMAHFGYVTFTFSTKEGAERLINANS